MKRLLAFLLFAAPVFGQGAYVPARTVNSSISGVLRPVLATVTVCAANTAGVPCAPPLAGVLFKDQALTQPLANPTTTDGNGNYPTMALAAGNYTITETASGFTGFSYQITITCGTGGCVASSLTISGPATFTGSVTASSSGVFTNTQMNNPFTTNTNAINFQTQYQAVQGGNFATEGFASGVNVPNTSTVYAANGISGYVANGSATTIGVGGNFVCRVIINSGKCFGANPIASDLVGLTTGVILTGMEVDTGPQNAPSAYNGTLGISSVLGGTSFDGGSVAANTYGSPAFNVGTNGGASSGGGGIQKRYWNGGYSTADNTINGAAFISGALGPSSTSNSQGIQFNSRLAGVLKSALITSDSNGNVLIAPVSGLGTQIQGYEFAAEQAAPGALGAGFEQKWADSTAHRWKMINNGGSVVSISGLIASGTQALNTASITTATCDAGVAATATGTVSTDSVTWSFASTVTTASKYGAFLVVYAVPSTNTITFYTCNPSATTSTPTAMSVNWSVVR